MDGFIQGSQEAGVVDSEGRFTLSGAQALAKLAEFTVRRPEQWVLKMVQAAAVGGAERLEVKQVRKEIRLIFPLAEPPSPGDVEQAIFAPELPTTPFLHELAIGLRSLLSRRNFVLSWATSTGHQSLHWNGTALEKGGEVAPEGTLEVAPSYAPSWFQAPSEQVDDSRALQTRAAYGTIPVILDGREITVFDLPVKSSSSGAIKAPPLHLAAGYLSEPLSEPETVAGTFLHNPLQATNPLLRWGRNKAGVRVSFSMFGSGATREKWEAVTPAKF